MPSPKTTAPAPADAPQADAPAAALPVDQWHGVGGEYVVENGVRRRVSGPPLGPEAEAQAQA